MNITIKLSLITTLLLTTNLIAEEKLEDIQVISATKTSQNINDVTSNINVITAQEIEERHYTTVTEALNSLPGINYTANGGTGHSSSIYLRGMSQKRVLVVIDGIRYNDLTGLTGAPLEHLIINNIERIEVLKGAQSGIWGADAAAGVINIITKKANTGLHGYASQEFGQFNSSKNDIGLSYKNNIISLQATQTRFDNNGFSAQAPKGVDLDRLEDDGYRNRTTNLKAGIQLNATNKIDISHTIIDSNTQYDNGPFGASALEKANNTLYNSSRKDRYSTINFNHIDSFNEFNLYANKSIINRDYPQGFTKAYDGEIKEYGLNSKIPYFIDSFINIGADYKKFEQKDTLNKSYTNKALFLTNNNKIATTLGTTTLTESIRDDRYSAFKNKTTGKIGLKHTFNLDGLTTSANYGTAYNVPTLNNLYGAYGPNPNLEPEEIKSYDVSIAYKDFSATYFHSTIDNLITYDFATGYNNVSGKSKIKGYELSYNTTFNDAIATNISYTRTNAEDSEHFELPKRVGKSIKFGLDYYGIEDLHLGVNGEYVGDRVEYTYGTHTVDAQTGNYTVANFVANYEVDPHLSFYGKVDNITDKYYQTVDGYATSPRAFYGGMKLTY